MKYENIGNSFIKASKVGMGTFEIGGTSLWGEIDDKNSIKTIQLAYAKGINIFDTAPMYGFGRAENVLGKAVKAFRSEIIISTKVGLTLDCAGSYVYTQSGKRIYNDLSKNGIEKQIKNSLKNLQTDYIDLITIHRHITQDNDASIESVCETLSCLIKKGVIRGVVLSNLSLEQIKKYYIELGEELVAVQTYNNVLEAGSHPNEIEIFCKEKNISLIGINGLALGALTGTFSDDYIPQPGTERYASKWFQNGNLKIINTLLNKWKNESCLDKDIPVSALCLGYLLNSDKGCSHVLAGASLPIHVIQNSIAGDLSLDKSFIKKMEKDVDIFDRRREEKFNQLKTEIDQIKKNNSRVLLWGAGVVGATLCKELGVDECNIVGIVDSDIKRSGECLFGKSVSHFSQIKEISEMAEYLIINVPLTRRELERILEEAGVKTKQKIFVGELKWA